VTENTPQPKKPGRPPRKEKYETARDKGRFSFCLVMEAIIRALQIENHVSRSDIARFLKVSRGQLATYTRGYVSSPTLYTARDFANAFGIPLHAFVETDPRERVKWAAMVSENWRKREIAEATAAKKAATAAEKAAKKPAKES